MAVGGQRVAAHGTALGAFDFDYQRVD